MGYITISEELATKFKKPATAFDYRDFSLSALTTQLILKDAPVLRKGIRFHEPGSNIVFPAVVDVKVDKERLSKEEKQKIEEKDRKNVYTIVMFDDGTVEKATTADGDEYNLEQGIQICLAKKAFSLIKGNGSNTFNALVNSAVKLYNNKENEKQRGKECEEKAKAAAKAEADKIKRKKDKEREKRINEMAEAYARAMRMVNEDENNV